MPLLPEIAAALQEIERSGARPAEDYPDAPSARRAVAERRARRTSPRSPVAQVEDRTVPGPGGPVAVRVYRPVGEGPHPVAVWMHGGGWTLDDLDGTDSEASRVCHESGHIVISVDYRRAPEHRFPAALEDCTAVCEWADAHVDELGGQGPVAVGGVSSGGNLAAAVCLVAAERGGPRYAAQLLVVPVLDLGYDSPSWERNASGYLLTRRSCEWYRDNYLGGADTALIDDPRVSPLRARTLTGLPPAFLLTAEYDPLRDDGARYAARLREAGVSVRHSDYAGVIHGFIGQFGPIASSERAFTEIGEVLRATRI
jgi:acetyl esterase